MESAFYLSYGPLPSIFLRMPFSTITVPASTKLHCGFNHSFISVSRGFSHRRWCHHFFITGPLALDRPNSMSSGNEKGIDKVVRGAVGASLALVCALSIFGCSCKMNFKAIACPPAPPTPRKMALKSLLDVTVNIASKEGRKIEDVLQCLLPSPKEIASRNSLPPSKDDIDQLKEAVNLMKCGKPNEALSMLKNEHEKYKKSYPKSDFTNYMTLARVEILIYQEKYDEALDLLKDEYQELPNLELRPTLYKAISLTMSNKETEAQEHWEKFAKSTGWM